MNVANPLVTTELDYCCFYAVSIDPRKACCIMIVTVIPKPSCISESPMAKIRCFPIFYFITTHCSAHSGREKRAKLLVFDYVSNV